MGALNERSGVEVKLEHPVEAVRHVGVEHSVGVPVGLAGLMDRALRAEPEADGGEVGLKYGLEDDLGRHDHPVTHRRDDGFILPPRGATVGFGFVKLA
jgi:hypothetical protein